MNTIRGKVIEILKEESGVSKAGKDWKKQDFVIETEDKYPKKVCLTLFGDKTDMIQSKSVGDLVDVTFDLESREWNGKWFTNVNAFSVNLAMEKAVDYGNMVQTAKGIEHKEQYDKAVDVETVEDSGDLPF